MVVLTPRCQLRSLLQSFYVYSPKKNYQPFLGSVLLILSSIVPPGELQAQQLSQTELINPQTISQVALGLDYILGAGDRLTIQVLGVPQFSGDYQVLVNGSLNLPRIGKVTVAGMTLEEATEVISQNYSQLLRKPVVTINLLQPRPLSIGIAGEINHPGTYTMEVAGARFPTITNALELAGGITQAADLRQAQVRRRHSFGEEQIIPVNLWELLQTGNLDYDVTLRDGDTIFIPTATNLNLSENSQLATASFASSQFEPLNIIVVGEVAEPGTHIVPEQGGIRQIPTITQALEVAGGVNPLADIRQIQIQRRTQTGSVQTINIDLWQLLQTGDASQNAFLQNGDTVIVPTVEDLNLAQAYQLSIASFAPNESQPLNIVIVGEVARPGSYTIAASARNVEGTGSGEPNTVKTRPTITRALQVAGGIKPQADIRQVQIRRYDSNGKEHLISTDLWELLQTGDATQDVILQQGDRIIVPTATELDTQEASQIAVASFAPETISVNVVGEVQRPGLARVLPNTSLNQALLAAGGFNRRSKTKSVELIRLNPDNTVVRRTVAINFSDGINEETNPLLRSNDVIVVGRSGLASFSDTLGTLLSPLGSFLRIFDAPSRLIRTVDDF